ncbi:S49 family peptidase [Candidatus Profftella armatura]
MDNEKKIGIESNINKNNWEKDTLEKVVMFNIRQQQSKHRWGIFFKIFSFILIIYIIFNMFYFSNNKIKIKHTALIDFKNIVQPDTYSSAERIIPALDKAFSSNNSVGVILRINSPGGTPVQASLIYDEIMRLKKIYPSKPLYAVVEEICTSGSYYIASAADKIYVNKSSIVGSIGVLMDNFGFTGLMNKLGIERRLLISGKNKGILDPFSPLDFKQKKYIEKILHDIHKQFIDSVCTGRGNRLKKSPDIFSGIFWTGSQAIELGLVDDYGTVFSVANNVLKQKRIVNYTETDNFSEKFFKKLGVSIGTGLGNVILGIKSNKIKLY